MRTAMWLAVARYCRWGMDTDWVDMVVALFSLIICIGCDLKELWA